MITRWFRAILERALLGDVDALLVDWVEVCRVLYGESW